MARVYFALTRKIIRGASPQKEKKDERALWTGGSNDFVKQNHYLSSSFGKTAGGRSLCSLSAFGGRTLEGSSQRRSTKIIKKT